MEKVTFDRLREVIDYDIDKLKENGELSCVLAIITAKNSGDERSSALAVYDSGNERSSALAVYGSDEELINAVAHAIIQQPALFKILLHGLVMAKMMKGEFEEIDEDGDEHRVEN